ncbi:EpsG family protein [Paenibacillus sp. URB8-2]|uniref:EpsG family protein n=1 Tax=Paenibacillus sp. URB8-2 TaxID=2741301 RepID=UPI0015BCD6BA|nr:EpsG family protein [Paenibacillus sp. URB8-2]
MNVYFVSYIIMFLLSVKEVVIQQYSKKQIRFFVFLFILSFSFLAGIRFGIGTDFFRYLIIFESINHYHDYEYLEPGFRLVVSMLKMMGFSSYSLFFIFSLFTLYFMFEGIRKKSVYPIFSSFIFILVFYIGYVFNGIRQGVVMGIFLYLLKDIEERNYKKVFIFALISISVHTSGIFIFIAYFFYNIMITRRRYFSLTVLLLVIFLTNRYFSNFVIDIMPNFVKTKLIIYSDNFEVSVDSLGILQRVLLLFPFLFYYPKLIRSNNSFEGLFKLYFLGFILYCIFSFQEMFATRINMLFRVLEIVLFPFLLKLDINKYEKSFIFFIVIIWASLLFLSELKNPANFPFVFFFPK